MLKRRSAIVGAAGFSIVAASAVRAQAWPSQPVKIIVCYVAGGATDTAARLMAERMTTALGQQVIVENRAGGNTIIGMDLVAKSKPDGHTLLLGTTTLATNAALGMKQPYDPLKDFQPVTTLADIPDFIAINKDHPAKDYKAYADWVNSQPQKVRFATSGIGNQPHLWGELFKTRNKLNMEVVAYKGAAEALRDVMGGHVPMIIDVVMPTGVHAHQGRLTGLAVSSEKRSSVAPNVPTVVELGMPDMVSSVFFGMVAPAGIPKPVLEKLNTVCRQIIKDPVVEAKFAEMGYMTTGSTPDGYLDRLKFETDRWSKVVKENNIKIES
jgi:tripartite-type tricarboxylate transporter receptor subunit TctC